MAREKDSLKKNYFGAQLFRRSVLHRYTLLFNREAMFAKLTP